MENTKHFNNFDDAVSYILEIPRFSAKNSMEDTKAFLKLIGEPDTKTIIHVAGTNGKGSTCAFLNSIHMEMGKKVGLFTSPHLVDIRERIQIDGKMISEGRFLACTNTILSKVEEFNHAGGAYHPSFFEFVFFIAVLAFAEENVDVAIYETGLGGRLDATNSLSRKSICVITEIGFDHMEYLGDTLEKIAGEKAGIIIDGVPVVFWASNEQEKYSCTKVIKKKAIEHNSEMFMVGEGNTEIRRLSQKSIDFYYNNSYDISNIFTMHSCAHYQVWNASLALKVLEVLYGTEVLANNEVKNGIANMRWPGRMECLEKNIFIDGGHNVDGVRAFLDSVAYDECKEKRVLIFSAVADKQVEEISKMIISSSLFSKIVLCELQGSRARTIDNLYQIFAETIENLKNINVELQISDSIIEAYEGEKEQLGKDDRLYVCGSLYLVGAIKEYIEAKIK